MAVWRAAWLEEAARRERVHQRDARADSDRGREGVVLRVGVEHRQHDELAVLAPQTGGGGHDVACERVVRLRDHHALGRGGCTAREHHSRRVAGRGQRVVGPTQGRAREAFDVRIGLVDDHDLGATRRAGGVRLGALGRADADDRLRTFHVPGQLGCGRLGIARHEPRTQAQRREPRGHECRRVGQRQVHGATGSHAARPEAAGARAPPARRTRHMTSA